VRTGILSTVLAVFLLPALASAADPPVVYQTQPVARFLDEGRTAAHLIGGEKAAKEFNDSIREKLGEKGFAGLDINRPIVGYVDIPADPTDTVAVLVLPVTGEADFLDFCQRWNRGSKPKAIKGGLYEVPALEPGLKAVMRITEGSAYIATGAKDPARVLTTVIPAGKLVDPVDGSLLTGRLYVDRLPKELRDKIATALDEAKKAISAAPLPPDLGDTAKKVIQQFSKMATRYLDLSKGAKEITAKIDTNPGTGDLSVELSLTAVPGSPLEKLIASRAASTNRFGGLITAETVSGFKGSLPLFAEEIRAAASEGLELARKQAGNEVPPFVKPFIDELLQGAIRTIKTGEVDIAAALRGPDKAGTYTAVGALSFEDPSAVEKEFRKVLDAFAPQEAKDLFSWDADKADNVNIHTFNIAKTPGYPNELQGVFGQEAVLAFAFAPKAVVLAMGPNAVAAVKEALALKPAPSPALDVVLNPSRMVKLIRAGGGAAEATWAEAALGKEDRLQSALSLSIAGGKELKLKFGINIKAFTGFFVSARSGPPLPEAKEPRP